METWVFFAALLVAFVAMARWGAEPPLVLPLVALVGLTLLGGGSAAEEVLRHGMADFARVAVLFTAVAVPAHLLLRSGLLDYIGLCLGEAVGVALVRLAGRTVLVVPTVCLVMTFVLAALLHNTTSILVSIPVIVRITETYGVPRLPVLCGALVASNLGGFSTRWGDTPNIIEAGVWRLSHVDFVSEILPINLAMLALLCVTITIWCAIRARSEQPNSFELMVRRFGFGAARRLVEIDRQSMFVGLGGLILSVALPIWLDKYEIALASASIVACCLLQRPGRRLETFLALGTETYVTLAGIFVLARIIADSPIGLGGHIMTILTASGVSVGAVALMSYAGTLLTEAASWANAAAALIHDVSPSHKAAWALGAGICAGSSSLVTAASAGVLLLRETRELKPDERVTFGSYICFGLPFSLLMLGFYVVVLAVVF